MSFFQYTTQTAEEALKILQSSERGLSDEEAAERRKACGLNEIKGATSGLKNILLRQLKSPFFYLLFAAGVISLFIGEKTDSAIIFLFVAINFILGFFQEARAEKAVSLLKKFIPSKAKVLRNDKDKVIGKADLVPGDIIILEAGNVIPADARVVKSRNLSVDESLISGESAFVFKTGNALKEQAKEVFSAENIVFSGTSVIGGEAEAVVFATGKNTELGQIAKLTSEIKKESAYEKSLLHFSNLILKVVVITIGLVFIANLFIKKGENIFDFTLFSIAMIVSIVPEALPTVATFALSQGSLKLARNKVVAKRLSAIEDLGDMEVLCTDKTGTLTENKLELHKINSSDGAKCALYALLVSGFAKQKIESSVNSFDAAVAKKTDKKTRDEIEQYDEIQKLPFDSFRMRNSALVQDRDRNRILIVKGAPEILLRLSGNVFGGKKKEEISKEIEQNGRDGKRTLGVAFKKMSAASFSEKDENGLTFLGYFSFIDPLKSTAKETIDIAKKLGVQIKIITGDGKEVAGAVAKEIGLIENSANVITGEALDSMGNAEFEKSCRDRAVFARVSPKTKYKIIEALEKEFEVGFLGEGINDAPALKAANVAIAVKEAADVSREAADIILLEKDLKVIVDGIKIGRNIFSNINKYIKCTLAGNVGNLFSISVISLMIPYLPMLPVQILLVNLLSDFPLVAVATDKVDAEELRKPKAYQLHQVIRLILSLALVNTIFDFIFFLAFKDFGEANLQTLWFIESILTEIVLIFSIRTRRFFLKSSKPAVYLVLLSILAAVITIGLPFTDFGRNAVHFTAPSIRNLSIVMFFIAGYFAISEIVKLEYFSRKKKANWTPGVQVKPG